MPAGMDALQAETQRRLAAEARVKELEATVSRLQARLAVLEGGGNGRVLKLGGGTNGIGENGIHGSKGKRADGSPISMATSLSMGAIPAAAATEEADIATDDAIDKAIRAYLERNPDFPVSIQKVAPNRYTFGDRGTVYVTQRGDHIVVRVGGGFKSLQVFMDERALMLTRDAAATLSERTSQSSPQSPASPTPGYMMPQQRGVPLNVVATT